MSALLALAILAGCDTAGLDTARSEGSVAIDITAAPYQVLLDGSRGRCGGVIVASDWILTAAHCTQEAWGTPLDPSLMWVTAGTSFPTSSTEPTVQGRAVDRVVTLGDYDEAAKELGHDLALLHLETPLAPDGVAVAAIDLADGSEPTLEAPGSLATVTGYGALRDGHLATQLQEVIMALVPLADAQAYYHLAAIGGDQLAGGGDWLAACGGDSGGPVVAHAADGRAVLVGLVSWGDGYACYPGFLHWLHGALGPSVFARVSAHADWIRATTAPPDAPPGTCTSGFCQNGSCACCPSADACDNQSSLGCKYVGSAAVYDPAACLSR